MLSAALEASGVALQIRDGSGNCVFAHPFADQLFRDDPNEAPEAEERAIDGRAVSIVRRRIDIDGRAFDVRAAIDAGAQRRVQDEVFQRAYFDPLTSLPNRELCDRAVNDLAGAGAAGQSFALVVIEVEKFTEMNAIHGEATGDALLRRIAQRIAHSLGEDEWLGRCGGDAFCVILPESAVGERYRDRVGRIVARLADPFFIEGVEIFASAKAGLGVWPTDDATGDGLWRKARAALAEARREAGARVRAYDPELERAQLQRGRLEMSLRAAIRDRRIACAFQPKVDFRAGVVDSLEALMRWRDEDGGWHSPGDFLDIAHSVGLTNDITRLVFEHVLDSLEAIAEAFRPGLRIGFNISARQAGDARFMRRFADDLAASGEAHRFVLELTEEAFLPATQFQTRVLPMLRDIGARISIDDFGAGFSSLATLADITADELKVDRSLIAGVDKKPRNQTLLRAIESIGDALGMEVIVEGVETETELQYLRNHTRIRVAQGYLLGRPLLLERVSNRADGARSAGKMGERYSQTRLVERRQAQ